MRRTELQHNTPEQVRAYLNEALAVVDELDVPEDLRGVAFAKAIDLSAAKNITVEQVNPGVFGGMQIPRGV